MHLEIELDMAEFTVLTPFPHTKAYDELKAQDRIFSYDWNDSSADKVVYYPKQMSPDKLQQLFYDAWDTFYQDESQEMKMFKLFQRAIQKEMADDTFRPRNRALASRAFGKEARSGATCRRGRTGVFAEMSRPRSQFDRKENPQGCSSPLRVGP